MKYDFAAIEKKWQDKWEQEKPYAAVTEYIEKKEAERREFIEQRRREDEALLEKALERFKCVK